MHEPRPAALAARTMTRHLKNLAHTAELDLLAPEAEAHYFAAPDGRRALVLWSDRGQITRTVNIGAGAQNVTQIDMFDNREAATLAAPGLAQIAIDVDPIFLTWQSADAAFIPTLPAPPLALPATLNLVPNKDVNLPVLVRNPTGAELKAELRISTVGNAPVKIAAPSLPITLAANGTQTVNVKLTTDNILPSFWTRQWTVFLPVVGDINLAEFKTIPREIIARGKTYTPKNGLPENLDLDLGKLNGGFVEKAQALCFAEVDLPQDAEVRFGMGADWWTEWAVNGEIVYSTLEKGNLADKNVLAHVFPVKLKKGKNLIAVKVLSGSDGWRLVAGGPDEVAAAERARAGAHDSVRVELFVDGKLLAREPAPVEVLRPVAEAENLDGPDALDHIAPDALIELTKNLFDAVPDTTRHYHGAEDLSGKIWISRIPNRSLDILAHVVDDTAKDGDKVTVTLATGDNLQTRQNFTAEKHVENGATYYGVRIKDNAVKGGAAALKQRFALSIRVEDDDWGELKQFYQLGARDDCSDWFQSWVAE
jgi:hypothetical protein